MADSTTDPRVLEERTTRYYYKLKEILHHEISGNDEKTTRFALFLADAIYGSGLPFAEEPAILDPRQNPYLAFFTNAEGVYLSNDTFCCNVFTTVTIGLSNPTDPNDWVYSTDPEHFMETLEEHSPDYSANINEHLIRKDLFLPVLSQKWLSLDQNKVELFYQVMWLFQISQIFNI